MNDLTVESVPAMNAQNIGKVMNRLKDTQIKFIIMTECKEDSIKDRSDKLEK